MDEPKYLEQLADKEVTGLSLRHEAIKRYLAELGTSPRSANGSSTSETLKSPCSRAASMDHGVCHVNRPGDSHSHPDGFSSVPQQRNDVDSQISLLQAKNKNLVAQLQESQLALEIAFEELKGACVQAKQLADEGSSHQQHILDMEFSAKKAMGLENTIGLQRPAINDLVLFASIGLKTRKAVLDNEWSMYFGRCGVNVEPDPELTKQEALTRIGGSAYVDSLIFFTLDARKWGSNIYQEKYGVSPEVVYRFADFSYFMNVLDWHSSVRTWYLNDLIIRDLGETYLRLARWFIQKVYPEKLFTTDRDFEAKGECQWIYRTLQEVYEMFSKWVFGKNPHRSRAAKSWAASRTKKRESVKSQERSVGLNPRWMVDEIMGV